MSYPSDLADNLIPQGSSSVPRKVIVISSTPGVAATNLGKQRGLTPTTSDVGIMLLAIRNDSGTVLDTNGKFTPLSTDATGALRVTSGAGGTITVQGGKANAGSDTSSGQTHLTVGGSDGTNLRPLKLSTNGILITDSSYTSWSNRSTAQTASTTSGATAITTGATTFTDRLGVLISNLSSTITIVIGIAESLGGSTPTVWEMSLPPNTSLPLNLVAGISIYVATTTGSALFSCKEFK